MTALSGDAGKRDNATIYLCKLNPEKRDAKGEPAYVATIGRVIRADGVYRFLPNTSTRKPSRKAHDTLLKCIPAWTERCGFLRLLEAHELPGASHV